ncbi:MAG: hypothetical protein LAO08_18170 [Acidobacteriia bacterium]|nr:hypothetical protein [Terriglobia bacterium]
MRRLWDISNFVRGLRIQLRFGELSRAPLRLLRLEMYNDTVECDWMARPPDPWDSDLSPSVSGRHVSMQALEDAIAIRELLFRLLPDVETGVLRVFRPGSEGDIELIISGTVAREQLATRHFHSVAMRAKLLGLQFWLEDGNLAAMLPQIQAMDLRAEEVSAVAVEK